MAFEIRECTNTETAKALFQEYATIKGAESCFVSFGEELADIAGFYAGGAVLIGWSDDAPAACVAIKKKDGTHCEAKRLFVKPEFRGNGYARAMMNAMLDRARALGFSEVSFTTKPSVMRTAYGLYKRMGFVETGEKDGIVSMKMDL